MKFLSLITFFLCFGAFAQKSVDKLLIFSPDSNSEKFNSIYTQNFFFGNFGIKSLVNAIPTESKNIKTIKISAESEGVKSKDVMILSYDSEGKLVQMNISEMLSGKAIDVEYIYKDGLIVEEIFKEKGVNRSNKFFYAEGKMVIQNIRGMVDVYQLKGNVLFKQTYLDSKPVFQDKIEGKCRITTYKQETIDKTCYSSFTGEIPFSIEEFTNSENVKTGKPTLVAEATWNLKNTGSNVYSFYNDSTELYRLELNENKTIKHFEFLGIKSEFKSAIHFSFNYEYHK